MDLTLRAASCQQSWISTTELCVFWLPPHSEAQVAAKAGSCPIGLTLLCLLAWRNYNCQRQSCWHLSVVCWFNWVRAQFPLHYNCAVLPGDRPQDEYALQARHMCIPSPGVPPECASTENCFQLVQDTPFEVKLCVNTLLRRLPVFTCCNWVRCKVSMRLRFLAAQDISLFNSSMQGLMPSDERKGGVKQCTLPQKLHRFCTSYTMQCTA